MNHDSRPSEPDNFGPDTFSYTDRNNEDITIYVTNGTPYTYKFINVLFKTYTLMLQRNFWEETVRKYIKS